MSKSGKETSKKDTIPTENTISGHTEYPWEIDMGSTDMFNDDEFLCYISFFIESSSTYYGLIELFNEAAVNGKRWEIKVISKEYIKNTVLDYCTKTREKKPFNLLCDQIIRYAGYDFENRIPPALLGYFLKYEIRKLKNAYEEHVGYQRRYEEARICRLAAVTKSGSPEKTEAEIIEVKVKSKNATKQKEQVNTSKQLKPIVSFGRRRPESELSIRSEERRDIRYVKHYPVKGPQVYLVITTIYEQLPSELIEVMKIPVVCIVKVGDEKVTEDNIENLGFDEYVFIVDERNHQDQTLSVEQCYSDINSKVMKMNWQNQYKFKNDKNKNVERDYQKILAELNTHYYSLTTKSDKINCEKVHNRKTNEVQRFWHSFNKKVRQPGNSGYEKTVLSKYIPSLDAVDYTRANWKELLKCILYDEITNALYNQYQIRELYDRYTSLNEVTILKPNHLDTAMEMNEYEAYLSGIPNECITIPFILESIINQVAECLKRNNRNSVIEFEENIKPKSDSTHCYLQNKLTKLKEHFDFGNHLIKCQRCTHFKDNTIMNKAHIFKKCKGKKSKLIIEKTSYVLKCIFGSQFKQLNESRKLKEAYKSHLILFENSLGVRQRKTLAEFLIVSETINTIMSKEILNQKKDKENGQASKNVKSTKKYEYIFEKELINLKYSAQTNDILGRRLKTIEEMNPSVLLQTLYDLTLNYNSYEVIYIPLLNSFLYKFYNCPKNIFRTVVMPTLINLRDFIRHSLPNEKEWAQNVLEDLHNTSIPEAYRLKIKTLSDDLEGKITAPVEITPKLYIDYSTFLPIEDDEEGDKKATSRFLRDISYHDAFITKPKLLKESTPDLLRLKPKIENIDQQIFLKNTNTKKGIDYSNLYKEKKINEIYDLGLGTRLQFNNRTIEASFRHGTKVRIQYKHKLYGKRTLDLEIQICNHRLYYSSHVNINSHQSKLLFIHRSGISLSFQEYKQQQLNEDEMSNEKVYATDMNELDNFYINPSPNPRKKLINSYSLTATLPSGFILETKFTGKENIYIKSYYLSDCLPHQYDDKELYRLFLQDNSVIKFLSNNFIQILFPTGKQILCHDYKWNGERSRNPQFKLNKYTIQHSCGKTYSYTAGGYEMYEGTVSIQETCNLSHDYKLLEMECGTRMLYKNDSTLVVEFIDGTRFISKIEVINPEQFSVGKNQRQSKTNEYIDFVIVLMTTTVEHPNFTTMTHCSLNNTTIIKISKDITIQILSNKTYHVTFSKGSSLSIKEDKLVFDKYKSGRIFQHSVIVPNVLKYNIIPNPPIIHFITSDIHGNELKINTQSEIYCKYALSEENVFCLKNIVTDSRFLLMRPNLSGFEIVPQLKLETQIKRTDKIGGSKVQNYWNLPYKETLLFSLVPKKNEHWHMPLATDSSHKVSDLPSTYGNSWLFPFKIKNELNPINSPCFLCHLKTLINENIKQAFNKTLEHYKKILNEDLKIKTCKCQNEDRLSKLKKTYIKNIGKQIYERGEVKIKFPSLTFKQFLKEHILLRTIKVANNEKFRPQELVKFKSKRSSIFNKRIPNYFSSPFGIAYFVSKRIQEQVCEAIEKYEYNNVLSILLDKNIKMIEDTDIIDAANLLMILKPDIYIEEIPIRNVLTAGRQLQDSFKSLGEIVKYHVGVKKISTKCFKDLNL